MTSCAQPGCTGLIVDGYCDVCGSPAGAAPFVSAEAAASAGLRAAADDGRLMAACAQPGCTGLIVDGYCDVCGSPAGAAPFVPAKAAASAGPRAAAHDPRLTARSTPTHAPSPIDEDTPTRLIPRAKTPLQQVSTQQMVHPAASDTGAVDDDIPTQRIPRVTMPSEQVPRQQIADPAPAVPQAVARKVEGEEELAEHESGGAQAYRTRVEEAQLPDNVREAALSEINKLERLSDQSPESGDIRTWLDTILELPWSTNAADWIEIQGSREVEATLWGLIKPAVANVAEGGTAELESGDVGSAVADVDRVDAVEVESAEVESAEVEPGAVGSAVADVDRIDAVEVESAEVESAEVEPGAVEFAVANVDEVDAAEVEFAEVESAEVEPGAVGSAVADVGEVDTAEAVSAEDESAAVDAEQADIAEVGSQDDDTVEMTGAAAVFSGNRYVPAQSPEQQVAGPKPVEIPREKRRIRSLTLAATVLALLIGAFLFSASRDGGVRAQSVPSVTPTTTAIASQPTSDPSDKSTKSMAKGSTIQLEDFPDSARPFEAIPIHGRYPGGEDTFVQAQHWDEGEWIAFPLPTKTDQSGEFTAHVELWQPGRYRLRVIDPSSGIASKTFILVVKG